MAAKRRKKHKNKISERVNSVCYIEQKSEFGLRPVGAIGAYAPEGMRNSEERSGNSELGMRNEVKKS